jgi:LuxR family maltose regulon positive regulatory protein
MALALWAAAEPGPVAWVCLDDYDNRPGVFWSYVIAALRRAGISVPRALPTAARGQAADHLCSCCGSRRRWLPRTRR